jgi:hypothetical protein
MKTCEWTYLPSLTKCGKPLTNKEIEFCKDHPDETDGLYLCFGHQGQYQRSKAKQEGYASTKDATESIDIRF